MNVDSALSPSVFDGWGGGVANLRGARIRCHLHGALKLTLWNPFINFLLLYILSPIMPNYIQTERDRHSKALMVANVNVASEF